jgi:hypothetical protein
MSVFYGSTRTSLLFENILFSHFRPPPFAVAASLPLILALARRKLLLQVLVLDQKKRLSTEVNNLFNGSTRT